MNFIVESEQEEDGRWIGEVVERPGALAYGRTQEEAIARAEALALRVVADRLEHGEITGDLVSVSFAAASVNGLPQKTGESLRRVNTVMYTASRQGHDEY